MVTIHNQTFYFLVNCVTIAEVIVKVGLKDGKVAMSRFSDDYLQSV